MTEREEVLLFAQQTGILERLSAGQKLRALIFAGEPAAVAFQQATELAGVPLSFEEGRGKGASYSGAHPVFVAIFTIT